jgi:hypothetical protein
MRLAEGQVRPVMADRSHAPVLQKRLHGPDAEKSKRVMEAMLKMKNLDIKLLKQAYEQR